MKNLIKKFVLITAVFSFGTACTNLDENLPTTYTKTFKPSNFGVGLKTAAADDGLNAAFTKLFDGIATNGGFFAVQEGGTDEAVITQKGGDWYDGGLYIKIHHHEFSPQTWAINDTWNQAYGGIYQCNDLLGKSPTAAQGAQLRALRAFFYWRLLDVFGNVPIVTSTATGAVQATQQQVFNFIDSELHAAIPNLPTGKAVYARISQGAALGLLSRLYLNAGVYTGTPKWQRVIDVADSVINAGVYTLSSSYGDIFKPNNTDNQEHMFVVPFDASTGGGAVWPYMTLHYPSQLTFKLQQQPWNGFSSLEAFYNSYDASDTIRQKHNFIVGPQHDVYGSPVLDIAFDKNDPDGAPVNYTPAINMLAPNASRQAGARFGKFSFELGQGTNANNDFPLIRYTEVLMNKAEAMARLAGDWNDGAALALLNQVRARVSANSLPIAPAAVVTKADWLAEFGREFFVEAHRRTDLLRYDAYGNSWWENPGDADIATHKLMAIPFEQIQAASSTAFPLKQNPGYPAN